MKNICIIPARSGSKGLKNKNMLYLDGKPMIFYTIEAAIKSKIFEKSDIYVSTDSKQYLEIIKTLGVKVVLRDTTLASDTATTKDVVIDFLKSFKEDNFALCLLQPTSPKRTSENLLKAYEIFQEFKNPVVSVTESDKSLRLFTTIDKKGTISTLENVDKGYRRQTEEKMYLPNGAIFITTKKDYLTNETFFTAKTRPYIMEDEHSIDVDNKKDFINILGINYFNHHKRYEKIEPEYIEKITKFKSMKESAIIGDSILYNLKIKNIDNHTVPGITLKTYLKNIKEYLKDKKLKRVIIHLGVNDLKNGTTIKGIEQDYLKLIDILRKNNVKIYLSKILYTLYRYEFDNSDIKQVNDFIEKLKKNKDIQIVDLNKYITQEQKLKFEFTSDGLHLNQNGVIEIEKVIEEIINN
ncbi:MAG: cytidylyltransferase domain-containing protein [Mycoplasmatales bacterium]